MTGRACRPVRLSTWLPGGQRRALAFVAGRASERYAPGTALPGAAGRIAARGRRYDATCLRAAWRRCAGRGIRDPVLRRQRGRMMQALCDRPGRVLRWRRRVDAPIPRPGGNMCIHKRIVASW
jgi:hypothetical protein